MRSVLPVLLSLTLPLLAARSSMAGLPKLPATKFLVGWTPESLVTGSPIIFSVKSSAALKSLNGTWLNRRVFFYFDAASQTWYGFAGVGINSVPGNHQLKLEAKLLRGARVSYSHSVPVSRVISQKVDLSVPEKYTEPDAEEMTRIIQERTVKRGVFEQTTEKRLWAGRFVPPINSQITEAFGTERIFNGVRQSLHQGLDFRASIGTPVGAMNSGRVTIARPMFFEGGFVVIYHGCGLTTLYMHLDRIRVNEGDCVKSGQIIGYSGASGRATGPHLHVGVRWQGLYLDPAALLAMKMDDLSKNAVLKKEEAKRAKTGKRGKTRKTTQETETGRVN
ncbi:MAG: M23 family metallopeptidase [Blastocatellia bacterium]|nr:M23 family metallopeptidase [Blastocatellia bacterium]